MDNPTRDNPRALQKLGKAIFCTKMFQESRVGSDAFSGIWIMQDREGLHVRFSLSVDALDNITDGNVDRALDILWGYGDSD